MSIGGVQYAPTGNPNNADGEVLLVIEMAGAIAPGAKIVVYFAHNTTRDFFRAINAAIHDNINKPSVISISWGGPEESWSASSLRTFSQAFHEAGTMGITVCCAAGDGGSSDGVVGRLAHVDFPASSPYVLACGGTRLESAGDSITSEAVWNDGLAGGTGGGGVSDFFPLPSWQQPARVPHSVNPGHLTAEACPTYPETPIRGPATEY